MPPQADVASLVHTKSDLKDQVRNPSSFWLAHGKMIVVYFAAYNVPQDRSRMLKGSEYVRAVSHAEDGASSLQANEN